VNGGSAFGIGLRHETPRPIAEIGACASRWDLEGHAGAGDHAVLFVSYFDDWIMSSSCPDIIYGPVAFHNNDSQGGLCQDGSGTEQEQGA